MLPFRCVVLIFGGVTGNNIPRLKEVKDYLGKCFSMKDLGEAAYILGIKIYVAFMLNNLDVVDVRVRSRHNCNVSNTSEYMATSEAAMEAVWIRKFVGDLRVMPSIKIPINMYCDNSAAIIFANDSGSDPFTKALPRGKVTDHANGIGLQLASSFMHTCD
ncbi:hypothetical protein Tco_0696282 [Tanacetum coccineum]